MSPKWTRIALAGICAAALVSYAWGIGRMQLHLYYGPGVLTMSRDWAAWLTGAYDPNLATTFDKLPGPFWLQALSARVFGYSSWAVLLPSLLASIGAILLLYRIVSRWASPWAGLAAAGFYAVTPLVAALARTQIPDPLLLVLLLAAIAAWQTAVTGSRWAPLLWSGVWVGLAFQAKMAQAWLAFVPLGLTYLLWAKGPWAGRIWRLLAAGGVAVGVSLVWVVPMWLIPAASRPWIDGSIDNSVWSMVFGYNGFNRYGVDNSGAEVLGIGGPPGRPEGPALLYLFRDGVMPQVGWLYPLALAGIVLGLRAAAHRTVTLMWTVWFVVHTFAFAISVKAHTFYNLALAPALAALAAIGLYHLVSRGWLLPLGVAATAAWGWYVAQRFPTFAPWLPEAVAIAGAVAVAALVITTVTARARTGGAATRAPVAPVHPSGAATADIEPARFHDAATREAVAATRWRGAAVVAAVAAMLIAPVTWSLSVTDNLSVSDAHRPAAGPPSRETASILSGRLLRMLPSDEMDRIAAHVKANLAGERYELAVQWAPQAGQFMLHGIKALPVGGFTAQVPTVTPDQLERWTVGGELRFALLDGPQTKGKPTPDYPGYSAWVRLNCKPVNGFDRTTYILYDCRR